MRKRVSLPHAVCAAWRQEVFIFNGVYEGLQAGSCPVRKLSVAFDTGETMFMTSAPVLMMVWLHAGMEQCHHLNNRDLDCK